MHICKFFVIFLFAKSEFCSFYYFQRLKTGVLFALSAARIRCWHQLRRPFRHLFNPSNPSVSVFCVGCLRFVAFLLKISLSSLFLQKFSFSSCKSQLFFVTLQPKIKLPVFNNWFLVILHVDSETRLKYVVYGE